MYDTFDEYMAESEFYAEEDDYSREDWELEQAQAKKDKEGSGYYDD